MSSKQDLGQQRQLTILINKDVSEPSYDDLKVTIRNHNYICTNRLVKAMVFPVVMYGCECWTINKAECQRIDAFRL